MDVKTFRDTDSDKWVCFFINVLEMYNSNLGVVMLMLNGAYILTIPILLSSEEN